MLILDGRPTGLSPRAFDLLWLLAQAASGDGRIVSRREIEKCLFGAQTVGKGAAADAIRDIRNQLGLVAGDREHTDGIIQTRHRQGYVLNLRADEVQLIS
jgi:DNA-binding winged helix-turn-helix (wHTH) protein